MNEDEGSEGTREDDRKTAIRVETKVNLSVRVCVRVYVCVCVCVRVRVCVCVVVVVGVVLYYINKKNKEQRTVWWKYACSFDRRAPMTSVVLGDIGGDTHKSCRDAHAHTYDPSFSAWIHFFAPKKRRKKSISVLPCNLSHSPPHVCSLSSNLVVVGGDVVSEIPASQMTTNI